MQNDKGRFIISLDFELYWGVRDVRTLESYKDNLDGTRVVVPTLLQLFNEFGVEATWATVGFLYFKDKQELLQNLPSVLPDYKEQNLSPYPVLKDIGDNEEQDPYHFASSLIDQILRCPGQELATHTFCHYYCLEPGQTAEAFRSDLRAAVSVATKRGVKLKSLIFPRNQFNEEYLQICADQGIISYRGNEASWMYRESSGEGQTAAKRAFRLLDSYLNISGNNCYSVAEIAATYPFNIPASRFLRPFNPKLSVFEPLRLKRIINDMTFAAKHGLVYHLWWHPHNFGVNISENIDSLRKILEHFRVLQQQYAMESVSMGTLSQKILVNRKNEE